MLLKTIIVMVSISYGQTPVEVKEFAGAPGVYAKCKSEARKLQSDTGTRHDCEIKRRKENE